MTYNEILNINSTALPFTTDTLSNIVDKNLVNGFVLCDYSVLIKTINDIISSKEYRVTLNPENIYNSSNNPINTVNVAIKVEGVRHSNSYFTNKVLYNNEYATFDTYSPELIDDIKELKEKVIKAKLWNFAVINRWFEKAEVKLNTSYKAYFASNYDVFKENVLMTSDFESFISCCSDELLQKCAELLRVKGLELLKKYKNELMMHVDTATRNEIDIVITKPIIVGIYMVSNYAAQCRRDWPRLNVTSLSKQAFDSLCWNI